jgi:hypothetical protein
MRLIYAHTIFLYSFESVLPTWNRQQKWTPEKCYEEFSPSVQLNDIVQYINTSSTSHTEIGRQSYGQKHDKLLDIDCTLIIKKTLLWHVMRYFGAVHYRRHRGDGRDCHCTDHRWRSRQRCDAVERERQWRQPVRVYSTSLLFLGSERSWYHLPSQSHWLVHFSY